MSLIKHLKDLLENKYNIEHDSKTIIIKNETHLIFVNLKERWWTTLIAWEYDDMSYPEQYILSLILIKYGILWNAPGSSGLTEIKHLVSKYQVLDDFIPMETLHSYKLIIMGLLDIYTRIQIIEDKSVQCN